MHESATTQLDVVRDGASEQRRLSFYESHILSQRVQVERLNRVVCAKINFASTRVVNAVQQFKNRCFPAFRKTDNGVLAGGLNFEVHFVENVDGVFWRVGISESHVLKAYVSVETDLVDSDTLVLLQRAYQRFPLDQLQKLFCVDSASSHQGRLRPKHRQEHEGENEGLHADVAACD